MKKWKFGAKTDIANIVKKVVQDQLYKQILEQSEDLIWMVDADFHLIYANQAYLALREEMRGEEKKLDDPIFIDGFGEGYIQRWRAYYFRALMGEYFQLEERFFHPKTKGLQNIQVTFKPILGEQQEVVAIACTSKDITAVVKRRSESRQMMDASLDVFCSINEEGIFTFVSAAATMHWGYTPEELIGTAYVDLLVEEDIGKTIEIADEILNGKNFTTFENRYRKKEGDIAYNFWSARWDDTAKMMYCVARDGKEKLEQQEQILLSEQRFKSLVQEGYDLIGILDLEGNYFYVSPTSTSILGIKPEEFIGKSAFEFIHPDDVERTRTSLKRLAKDNRVVVEAFRFQNHLKEWRWVETVLTNMLDNRAVNGIVANSRDITTKVEEEYRRKLLESVTTNTSDAVLITEAMSFDEPGPKIIYVNDAFTKMTGYTAEEVLGKTPRILQGPNSNKEELKKLGKALRNRETYEITTINYKKNGEEFWINFTVTPVIDEKGSFTHCVAIERDVTEQKNQELKKDLLSQISLKFNEKNDFVIASKELCSIVSAFGKYELVELWVPNFEKRTFTLLCHHLENPNDEIFYNHPGKINSLHFSEGLTGKVWEDEREVLWNVIDESSDFVRKEAAKKIGLRSVLGVPLKFNDELIGVLNIGSKREATYLEKYASILSQLQEFIGSELNRKKLETDLNIILEAIPDIISTSDFQGRFLKINKTGSAILGYAEHEILNHNFESFIHPDDKERALNELINIKDNGVLKNLEFRFITKSGGVVWLSWYCKPSFEEGLIYCTARNITEEKKLRELNRQTRHLARIGSWEVDLNNQSVYWSEEVHKMHETDPESFVPELETAINFYREDFREMVQSAISTSISQGVPFDFETVLVTANKNEIWVRAIGSAEFVNGTCTRFFGSLQDINERKEAELRLQSLANNLPGVVFQYFIYPDGADTLKFVSAGAKDVWGFTNEQVVDDIQLVWDQIRKGGHFDEVKASILKSVDTKSKWTSRFKYVYPNGELRTHIGHGTPSFLSDGTVLFNAIVLDISQEARNEELLKEASKIARLGSWQLDLINKYNNNMYWSPIVWEILELDDDYDPSLTGGLELLQAESKGRMQSAMADLVKNGKEFVVELLVKTGRGNERWVRVSGKSERVADRSVNVYGSLQDIHQQKMVSEDLKMAFDEKNTILESLGDAFFAVDTNWLVTYWNKEAELVLGTKTEEIVGKNLWDIYSDAVDSEFYHRYHKAFETGETANFESYYSALNMWVDVSVYPSKQGLSIYFKNITDRKKAEQENNRLFVTLENSLNEIFIFDAKTLRFSYVNKVALLNLGYTQQELETLTPLDLKPDFTAESFNQIIEPLIKNEKERVVFFTIHKRKNGSLYPVEVHLQLVGEGNSSSLIAIILDITERKNAEMKILEANERFEKVTEATNEAIWDWDIVNQTFYRSKAIELFLGKKVTKSLSVQDFWKDEIHSDDLESIQNSIEKEIADPTSFRWEQEYRIINVNNEIVYVLDRGVIVRNSSGKAIRMIGAMSDITGQKLLNAKLISLNLELERHAKELERSNEELEQFAFVTSHDLQEPLRMISSFMEQLKRRYENQLDEKALLYIHYATDGAKRMKQIIIDLLEYSRANNPRENLEVVDLNVIVSDFQILRRKIITESKATILVDNLPALNTYKALAIQIFHCLIDNAIKYRREGVAPVIEIKVEEKEKEWEFSIKDNGIGIDEEFYEKIFVIFQSLHNREVYEGTGIGLSIVKKSIEFLGGHVWLESIIGRGTTFYFTIPR